MPILLNVLFAELASNREAVLAEESSLKAAAQPLLDLLNDLDAIKELDRSGQYTAHHLFYSHNVRFNSYTGVFYYA